MINFLISPCSFCSYSSIKSGDFNYPILDASREDARKRMREEEDGLVYKPRPLGKAKTTKGKGRQIDQLEPPLPPHRSSYGRLADRSSTSSESISTAVMATNEQVSFALGEADSDEEVQNSSARWQSLGEVGRKSRLPKDAVDFMIVDRNGEGNGAVS